MRQSHKPIPIHCPIFLMHNYSNLLLIFVSSVSLVVIIALIILSYILYAYLISCFIIVFFLNYYVFCIFWVLKYYRVCNNCIIYFWVILCILASITHWCLLIYRYIKVSFHISELQALLYILLSYKVLLCIFIIIRYYSLFI